jgi:hypothetical protein
MHIWSKDCNVCDRVDQRMLVSIGIDIIAMHQRPTVVEGFKILMEGCWSVLTLTSL